MKRKLFFICYFLFILTCAFSIPLEDLVSIDFASRLRSSSEVITEIQLRNPVPRLLPGNSDIHQFITGIKNSLNPNMMGEALYLYKKPVQFYTPAGNWDNGQKTQVFNQIVAISSLAGTQYFSASRNTMRTFYENSSVIDNPQAKRPLTDPVFSQIPETLTLYARQKDLTFGDNIYSYNYVNTGGAVFFVQENVTALSYGIIPAIGRGNLRSVVALIDCGDSILVYVNSMAKASSSRGMSDRISASFSNRATAILRWLTGRLDRELFSQ